MDHNARGRAEGVVKAVGVNGARRMLDLGGGSGAFSIAFAKAAPELRGEILDLPEVLPITQEHLRRAGVADRISTRAGDMLQSDLGKDLDLVLLSAICHMFSPEENRQLLRADLPGAGAQRARGGAGLHPGGATRPRRNSARCLRLNMLVGTTAGASYSEPEYTEWMKRGGLPRDASGCGCRDRAGLMIGKK